MNPFDLIIWALAAAAAVIIVGIAFAMVVAITRGLSDRMRNR